MNWRSVDRLYIIWIIDSLVFLFVRAVPDTDPTIGGYDGTPRYPGNSVTLTCTVSGGVPLATLTWTCKGTTVQGTDSNSGTVAMSKYTVSIDRSYNGQTCSCIASHPTWNGNKVVQSPSFVVHYPPSSNPTISGYDGSARYKDDTVTLTCQVSGGSPLATLSWTCNGQSVTGNTGRSTSTTVTNDLTVTMTAELNGKTCICQGRHSDPSYVKDVPSTAFVVYYPPSLSLIEAASTTQFPWIEGGSGILQCSATEGNPPMTYEWLNAAGVISGQTTNTLSLTSLTKDDNRKSYRCKVSNAYTVQKNQNLISQPRVLDVEYRPVINIGTSPSFIRETETFERICTADGNPTPTITWTTNTNPSNGATLVNIMRNQTGDYTCTAQVQSRGAHGLLSNQADLKIIVQYPPTVHVIFDKSSALEGQGLSMYCSASGIPDRYTYNGWVQEYKNIVIRSANEFRTLSQNKNNLTLSEVSYQDIGTYKCKAENTITDKNGNLPQEGASDLDIKFSAVLNSSRRFYSELNRTVEMKIPFFSNPSIKNVDAISLTKQNINQKGRANIKINVGNTNLDLVFYGKTINVAGQEIIIQMFQFNGDLQGNYTIGIQNYQEGSVSSFVFEVIPSGPPEHPINFQILKTSDSSVTVTWLAGNNGGHPQTFVMSYKQTGKDDTLETKHVPEIEKKENYTLTVTDLLPETEYSFWIYAYNSKGNTTPIGGKETPVVLKTPKLAEDDSDSTGVIAGVVVAVLVVSVILVITGICYLRRRVIKRDSKKEEKKSSKETRNDGKYEDLTNERTEATVYDGIQNQSNAYENIGGDIREINQYETLERGNQSNTYQTLEPKEADAIPMETIYVNTTLN